MKILCIGTSVVPLGRGLYGGIEKLCYDFVEGLKEAGQDVTVAAPYGSRVPDGVRLIETVKLPEEQDHDDYALNRMLATDGFWDFDVAHDFSHGHLLAKTYNNVGVCDGKDIKLHFNVTEEEKIQFLQNAKAVIYPVQQEEAHWLVGIEASACGTLTITSAVGAFPEVCYGFVARNEGDFKGMMKNMSWMSDLTPDMWAEKHYSRDRVIPKYLKLYRDVAEGKRW